MNLRVVDHQGKMLGQGRDLRALERRFEAAAGEGARALAAQDGDDTALAGLPEQALPASRVTNQAGIRVEAFPALVAQRDGYRVELFDHPAKAEEAHRRGVVRAAMDQLPELVRDIEKLPGLAPCALLFTKVGSWRVMLSALIGGIVMGLIFNVLPANLTNGLTSFPWYQHILVGGFMFGVVFMATDPVTATQTIKGKWIYGFLIGILSIMIRVVNPAYPEGVMMAILLMNVFAPTIDYYVVQGNIKRRRKRLETTTLKSA